MQKSHEATMYKPTPFKAVRRTLAALGLIAALAAGSLAAPGWESYLNYQGQLTDNVGSPVADGTYSVTFSIYDAVTAGTLLWTETNTNVVVSKGLFNVVLGSINAITLPDTNINLWLAINVNSTGDMTPRQQLLASMYSLNSKRVDGSLVGSGALNIPRLDINGKLPASMINGGSVGVPLDMVGAGGTYNLRVNDTTVGGKGIVADSSTGIAVSATTASTTVPALYVESGRYGVSTKTNDAINGVALQAYGPGSAYASLIDKVNNAQVYGLGSSSVIYGVLGSNNGAGVTSSGVGGYSVNGIGVSGTGGTHGVFGLSNSGNGVTGQSSGGYGVQGTGATGVYGFSSSNFGVYGNSSFIGVWGNGNTAGVKGTSGVKAVWGEGSGTTAIGVYGSSLTNSGVNYGVYGQDVSVSGVGVYGLNTAGVGVKGDGVTIGVYGASGVTGVAGSGGQWGVWGEVDSSGGAGVFAISGDPDSPALKAVQNYSSGTSEPAGSFQTMDLAGTAINAFGGPSTGMGVYATGGLYAVYGNANGTLSSGTYGVAYGSGSMSVRGENVWFNGYSGYFRNTGVGNPGVGIYGEGSYIGLSISARQNTSTGFAVVAYGKTGYKAVPFAGGTGYTVDTTGDPAYGFYFDNAAPAASAEGIYARNACVTCHSGHFVNQSPGTLNTLGEALWVQGKVRLSDAAGRYVGPTYTATSWVVNSTSIGATKANTIESTSAILITPMNPITSGAFWLSSVGSGTFTINTSVGLASATFNYLIINQ